MKSKLGKAAPETCEQDKTIQALASEARSKLSPHITEAWIAHSPFLVQGMESHLLATPALQKIDCEMSNLGLASLTAHKRNIATGIPARSTTAPDVQTAAPPHYPAEIDLGHDLPIAPKARPLIQPARSHRVSPQTSTSPITIPSLPPSQSPALSTSMLFSQSPHYSPKSPAADTSPAVEVSQGLRRSTRAATVAASTANVVRRVVILSPVHP